jgi:hypothetical protein
VGQIYFGDQPPKWVRFTPALTVTGADNPWGFPSKDRSGRLAPIEEPHLGKLIAKCLGRTAAAHASALSHSTDLNAFKE